MTNYKGTIEQHISELELAIANAEDETHKTYWQREKEFLEELQWYKNQDLVRRRDVIKNLNEEFAKLPTAEPPHTTVDERSGDCETCKHYTEQQRLSYDCRECIEMGMKDYEPYIPR